MRVVCRKKSESAVRNVATWVVVVVESKVSRAGRGCNCSVVVKVIEVEVVAT